MIFVTVGSQKFQFNRLLKEIDRLIKSGIITEEVYAQTGYSEYTPKNYDFKKFLDRNEFEKIMKKCDKVITHGGTGAIITALKNNKLVIAIPRDYRYKEHVDNHQFQIVKLFSECNFIEGIYDVKMLNSSISNFLKKTYKKYESNTINIQKSIDNFINNN